MRINTDYKFGFDIFALLLFILIMIPNFIWFIFPAPNDILREDSVTGTVDIIASIFQVIFIASVCFITNPNKARNKTLIYIITLCTVLYFICWILYYINTVNYLIIFGLCIFPCLAFLLYAVERKNITAIISSIIFMICHLIYGTVNFII